MRNIYLSLFGLLVLSLGARAQDVRFSFTVNNNDPTVSVVSMFAEFDGSGNSNAIGYTLVFYYDATEVSIGAANWDFTPTTNLGWNTAGNNTIVFSPVDPPNPLVPITHNQKLELQIFDSNIVGTDFTTTPTLLGTLTFNKTIGTPQVGGWVYGGGTDTDGGIVYNDSNGNGHPVILVGDREQILPLRLLSFSAKAMENKHAGLTWFTQDEINTSHFQIERSSDLRNWTKAGEVDASVFTTEVKSYGFVDAGVFDGRRTSLAVHYRLKMVDLDDKYSYSPIETVIFRGEGVVVTPYLAYPNPAKEGVTIEWDANALGQPTTIELYDVAGKLIHVQDVAPNSNQEYIDFVAARASTGMCMVRLMAGTEILDVKQIIIGQN